MSNNNQPATIWFAVDMFGRQFASDKKPFRNGSTWGWDRGTATVIPYPLSIQAITGRTLTWADEPLEWKPGEKECEHPWASVIENADGGGRCLVCNKLL